MFHIPYWFLKGWLCTWFWQIIFLDNWVQDYLSLTLQPEFFRAVVKLSVKYLPMSSFASWGYLNFLQLLKVTKSWKQTGAASAQLPSTPIVSLCQWERGNCNRNVSVQISTSALRSLPKIVISMARNLAVGHGVSVCSQRNLTIPYLLGNLNQIVVSVK